MIINFSLFWRKPLNVFHITWIIRLFMFWQYRVYLYCAWLFAFKYFHIEFTIYWYAYWLFQFKCEILSYFNLHILIISCEAASTFSLFSILVKLAIGDELVSDWNVFSSYIGYVMLHSYTTFRTFHDIYDYCLAIYDVWIVHTYDMFHMYAMHMRDELHIKHKYHTYASYI